MSQGNVRLKIGVMWVDQQFSVDGLAMDQWMTVQVIGWAFGMLLRRHLPTEKAVEVFGQEADCLC